MKDESNSVIHFEANNNVVPAVYQEKTIADPNRIANDPVMLQTNEFQKLDGQGQILNQVLSQPTQWSNSSEMSQYPNLPINKFVPEINEFVGRFVALNKGEFGSTEAKFSLFPENLGHIGVKILAHEGQITAQIMTETPAAKQVLEGQLHQLRQALIEQGLVVQKLDIIQQPIPSANTNQADLSFSQGNSGFSREQRREDHGGKKQNSLEPLEVDNASPPSAYRGSVSKSTSNIDFSA